LSTKPDITDPALLVLQRTEAFTDVWDDLASSVGCRVVRGGPSDDPASRSRAAAVILAVGGAEQKAYEDLASADEWSPVAAVGAEADHRLAASLLRAGADDYFALPGDMGALQAWLENVVDRARARSRAETLAARERERYDFSGMVGQSEGLETALKRASRVIPRGSATILITGETGTGKELLAQAIHYNGPRAAQPFVEVNCTALPESLLEAELFGFERGAFTDARTAKPGLFEAASGGTLFLDEIGDLALTVQAKLLKALEEKRVRRLGSLTATEVDVRIIAATHVDLARSVREGRFREDLFYRLNVLPIHLPPLRERGEDVVALAEHFLARASQEYGIEAPLLDAPARQSLLAHGWPGNVRELRNAIERAVLLGEGTVRPEELFLAPAIPPEAGSLPFPASLRQIEIAAARLAVERTGGNKRAAADLLNVSRTRLYRLLESDDDPANPV
jgi:two-component system response regulator HydG